MVEFWRDIEGYEGRYQVSNFGRVKALAFKQRYTHWRTGQEMFRQTKERILSQQLMVAGYLLVHLHLDNQRTAFLVHRLVATAFLRGPAERTVNHIDGDKTNNRADNLEWATHSENLNHAVDLGLNRQSKPVAGYPSTNRAAKALGISHRTLRKRMKDASCLA